LRYLAFVLHTNSPDNVRVIDLGEAELIDHLIAQFRMSLTGRLEQRDLATTLLPVVAQRDAEAQRSAILAVARHLRVDMQALSTINSEIGSLLRAKVWDPLLPAVNGCTNLYLAPDGDLNRLPFETLPLNDGRYVIDICQLSYLSVGRDLLQFGMPMIGQASSALIIADPDFALSAAPERRTRLPFLPLAGTRHEGEQLAKLLNVHPVMDRSALKSRLRIPHSDRPDRLRGQRGSPCILHLATHGFFIPDQPDASNVRPLASDIFAGSDSAFGRLKRHHLSNPLLRSGLALAGANTWLQGDELPGEAENGILFAEDVTGADLLNTELVVLSACDTGLGDIHVGEGVYGLRRAFVLAGAKTLVMSLWKVPDAQTQKLMIDFYQRILAGRPRAEALRKAQLALKERYPHPWYWGAFICQGNPGPLLQKG
jgi:CHAT domain-containing protein